jgi:hypothetical protein
VESWLRSYAAIVIEALRLLSMVYVNFLSRVEHGYFPSASGFWSHRFGMRLFGRRGELVDEFVELLVDGYRRSARWGYLESKVMLADLDLTHGEVPVGI